MAPFCCCSGRFALLCFSGHCAQLFLRQLIVLSSSTLKRKRKKEKEKRKAIQEQQEKANNEIWDINSDISVLCAGRRYTNWHCRIILQRSASLPGTTEHYWQQQQQTEYCTSHSPLALCWLMNRKKTVETNPKEDSNTNSTDEHRLNLPGSGRKKKVNDNQMPIRHPKQFDMWCNLNFICCSSENKRKY